MGKHRGKKDESIDGELAKKKKKHGELDDVLEALAEGEPRGPSLKKTKVDPEAHPKKKTHGDEPMRYGVLKGRAVKRKRGDKRSPYYRITVRAAREGDGAGSWEVGVDVRSTEASRLLFHVDADVVRQPKDRAAVGNGWVDRLALLSTLPIGWNALERHRPGVALDYVRESYVDRSEMTELGFEGAAADDDVRDQVDFWIERAIKRKADFYVFGSRYDKKKTHGVHDVHLNQGNVGAKSGEGGPYRDGALVIHFASGKIVALFFAFADQAWEKDSDPD